MTDLPATTGDPLLDTVLAYGLATAEAAEATARGDEQRARVANRESMELLGRLCLERLGGPDRPDS